MTRLLRALLSGLVLCLWGSMVHAQAKVLLVASDHSPAYTQAAQALSGQLVRSGLSASDIQLLSVSEWSVQSAWLPRPRVYVALGTAAADALVISQGPTPVLAALLPRRSFEQILHHSARRASARLSAIYLDQPLLRQLALIRLALPEAQRVGVLFGPDSVYQAERLRALASSQGLTLHEAVVHADDLNLFAPLQQVLLGSDVLLALADPLVFNSTSIQNMLLTTFRAKLPMVAFSPAYVRAGALWALHVTPEQVGLQAARLVQTVLQGGNLPEQPVESDDFEVSVNAHVARALNLNLDAQALRLQLRAWEQKP